MSNADTNQTNRTRSRSISYRDGVLTAIAALLAINVLKGSETAGLPGASEALAQRAGPEAYGVPNASEQRARMIRVMEEMGAKIQALASTVEKGGFKVEVTSMPKVELAQ